MILFFLFLLFVCLYRIKISRHGFFYDFLEREQTNSIKGIFIFFVFLRHILQYIRRSGYDFSSYGDAIVTTLDSKIGQLIVVMFLLLQMDMILLQKKLKYQKMVNYAYFYPITIQLKKCLLV